jgi:hypothetical protein
MVVKNSDNNGTEGKHINLTASAVPKTLVDHCWLESKKKYFNGAKRRIKWTFGQLST